MSHTPRVALRLATAFGLASLVATSLGDLTSRTRAPRAGVGPPPTRSVSYGRLPLAFEQNTGRYDPRVQFLTRARGATIFLTNTEAVMVLRGKPGADSREPRAGTQAARGAVASPAPSGGRGSGGGG